MVLHEKEFMLFFLSLRKLLIQILILVMYGIPAGILLEIMVIP